VILPAKQERTIVINKKNKPRRKASDITFNILNYTFFGLFTFLCIFPFYYLFINTISDNQLVSLGQVTLFPRGIHFENYMQVLKLEGLAEAALTSIARTVLGTLWTVGGSAFLGYLVTKKEMWHRKLFYRLIIITMYFNAGLIPWYMNMRSLGFIDSFWAYVIPVLVSPYNVILVKTFIESVPSSLEESANLDGAGYTVAFVKVILPLITPIIATLAIFSAVDQWNRFTDTLILMPSGKNYQHRSQE
jgi:putative aldouronate transport system permease protein